MTDWPVHTTAEMPYKPLVRPSRREDRLFTRMSVSLPPLLIDVPQYVLPGGLLADLERATSALARLDYAPALTYPAVGELLLRSEAVSSSRIEEIEATPEAYALAYAGRHESDDAVLMVQGTHALTQLVQAVGDAGVITHAQLWSAHRTLLATDKNEAGRIGKYREEQNWIGGSKGSPLGAIHVPPPPEMVREYMDDLLVFANRNDMSALVQAAIVHAQFESIHPFTDGNGRIGRALIAAVLRRRGLTHNVVAPVAAALVASRDRYFHGVNVYRAGFLAPFLSHLLVATIVACEEAMQTAGVIAGLDAMWHDRLRMSRNSTAERILGLLVQFPVQTSEQLEAALGGDPTTLGKAVARLERAGLVREITGRLRNRAWVAGDVLDAVEIMNTNIYRRMQPPVGPPPVTSQVG